MLSTRIVQLYGCCIIRVWEVKDDPGPAKSLIGSCSTHLESPSRDWAVARSCIMGPCQFVLGALDRQTMPYQARELTMDAKVLG